MCAGISFRQRWSSCRTVANAEKPSQANSTSTSVGTHTDLAPTPFHMGVQESQSERRALIPYYRNVLTERDGCGPPTLLLVPCHAAIRGV